MLDHYSKVSKATGYRTPNRIAATCIVVACIAITISVSYLKQERLRQVVAFTELNSQFVLKGGYLVHEGYEAVAMQVPPTMDFSNLDFRSLILDGTSVDDSGIQKLAASNIILTRLSLRNTRVTDATLQTLAQYKTLLELELGDGEITAEGYLDTIFGQSLRLSCI